MRLPLAGLVLLLAPLVMTFTLGAHAPPGPEQPDQPAAGVASARFMRAHLGEAMVLHAAVIRGDLPAAAASARAITRLGDDQFPAGGLSYVAAMKRAAGRAAAAVDPLGAGRATAEMLSACGGCHRALGTRPPVPELQRPPVGGVVGHMLEHQVAVDLLLEGLVAPSDSAWRAGARALMVAPLNPSDLPVDSALRRQLAPTEERVHRMASDAIQATDPLSRAAFYGQILAGCADCHHRHARIWGPKPPPR